MKISRVFAGLLTMVSLLTFVGIHAAAKSSTPVIDETFYDSDKSGGWESRAFEVYNLGLDIFDPVGAGAEGLPCLYNTDKTKAGYIIYKLETTEERGFTEFLVRWSGRVLKSVDSSAEMVMYIGTDNKSWTEVYRSTGQDNYSAKSEQSFIDNVTGDKVVYLKIEMACRNASWTCLRTLQIYADSVAATTTAEDTILSAAEKTGGGTKIVYHTSSLGTTSTGYRSAVIAILAATAVLLIGFSLIIVHLIKTDQRQQNKGKGGL